MVGLKGYAKNIAELGERETSVRGSGPFFPGE